MKEGRIPLQTFRADIDYGFAESFTKMGLIGVKVWIFKRELFRKSERELVAEARLVEKPEDISVPDTSAVVEDVSNEIIPEEEEDNVVTEKSKI